LLVTPFSCVNKVTLVPKLKLVNTLKLKITEPSGITVYKKEAVLKVIFSST
jgi:hypothetical protein